jgi:hypothetical protein
MSDIINQAMGILGGGKKDKDKKPLAESRTPAPARAPAAPPAPVRPHARQINEMIDTAERRVKAELSRYGLLHARLLEARELLKGGSDTILVENTIRFALNEAKVTIK